MKTVKRILLGLLGLVMGLVILLAGSIAIDFSVGAGSHPKPARPGQNLWRPGCWRTVASIGAV
jgi:hypothetical protein